MYTYKTRLAVDQTGEDGLQTVISILDMMQSCSQFWFESEPELETFLREHGMALFFSYRQLDIFKRAGYGENLTVKTSIFDCKDYFGYRNTVLYGEDGTPYAKSWGQGVFVDIATGAPARCPKEFLEFVTLDGKIDMEYLPRRIKLPSAAFEVFPSLLPSPFDIDFNHHVNNVRYVQMACEHLPEYAEYDRLRIEYKLAAKRGDVIVPQVLRTAEAAYVKLCNPQGRAYCITEYSKRTHDPLF